MTTRREEVVYEHEAPYVHSDGQREVGAIEVFIYGPCMWQEEEIILDCYSIGYIVGSCCPIGAHLQPTPHRFDCLCSRCHH